MSRSAGGRGGRGSGSGRGRSGRDDRRGGNGGRPPSGARSAPPGRGGGPRSRGDERRAPQGPPGLGGDQVEGRNAVRELLAAGRRTVHEVMVTTDLDDSPVVAEIVDLARERRVTVTQMSRNRLASAATSEAPQGVIARAAPLKAVELEDLVSGSGTPFLVALDGLTDPGNLGTILRTAQCAGVDGIVLPRHRAVRVTPTVAKAAAGAIEHLRIAQVGGLPAALAKLGELGLWRIGLDGDGRTSVFQLRVAADPVVLVLGAEGRGMSRLVKERCDELVAVPNAGPLDSLNVSAAAAVACYEIVRARST